MKQVLIKKGRAIAVDMPVPEAISGFILVELRASCISPGTEMSNVAATGQSLFKRIASQPERIKQAWSLAREKGINAVLNKAQSAMEKEVACGYSAAGVVVDVGLNTDGFTIGQAVAVAGVGYAHHAEIVAVPVNLAVPIPAGCGFDEASTVAIGAIAMQGVRKAEVTLGECVGVIGCGPLGLLTVQMLKAGGCRVFASDIDQSRLSMALDMGADAVALSGAEDIVQKGMHVSGSHGMDAVIITASTSSSAPLSQAFNLCRRRGRVILVGVAGHEYQRSDMYAKELELRISTSYGPGRYDEQYERYGVDYPYAYVRWTENRNMRAYLALIAERKVKLDAFLTETFPVENASEAYERLKAADRPLLSVIHYAENSFKRENPVEKCPDRVKVDWSPIGKTRPVRLALIGTGGFLQGMHLPNLLKLKNAYEIVWACGGTSGVSARQVANSVANCRATANVDEVLRDVSVDAVMISTRHDTHGDLSARALEAGKAVFVEKPMCLSLLEYERLEKILSVTSAPFMVGYNRRFSPFAEHIRKEIAQRVHPVMIHYTMNAGYIPAQHWTQTPEGGGRLMGEGCHIIDLFRYLIGCPVESMHCEPLRGKNDGIFPTDNLSLTLKYEDGSIATLLYTALGNKALSKERMELFFDGKTFLLDDYKELVGLGTASKSRTLQSQDKGHFRELEEFYSAVSEDGRAPIPYEELLETWNVTHFADRICRKGYSESMQNEKSVDFEK